MNTNNKEVAANSIKAVWAHRAQISELQNQICRLEAAAKVAEEQFIGAKLAENWRKFEYYSSYFGSHSELGEGDHERVLLFHPSVDLSTWDGVTFSHGHFSQSENNGRFESWLTGIPEDQRIEL